MLDKMIEHNGIIPMGEVREASEMYQEQLKASYIEGFKRCHYIRMIEQGYTPPADDRIPDDFDTYFKLNYGE